MDIASKPRIVHQIAVAMEATSEDESPFCIQANINKTEASLVIPGIKDAVTTHGRSRMKLVYCNAKAHGCHETPITKIVEADMLEEVEPEELTVSGLVPLGWVVSEKAANEL